MADDFADDFRNHGHVRGLEDIAVERPPADLAAIYGQLTRDSEGWARRLPVAEPLQDYLRALSIEKALGDAVVSPRGSAAAARHEQFDLSDEQPGGVAPGGRLSVPSAHPGRRAVWGGALAAALVVALLASILAFAARGRAPIDGHRVATPSATTCALGSISVSLPAHAQITKLAMVSPTDGWALGSIEINGGVSFQPFLERFQQCRWSPAPALPISNAVLNDLAMPSATDGWAVGNTIGGTRSGYVLLHYSGGRWVSATLPPPIPQQGALADAISYVRMLSTDEGWLVTYWGDSEADTSFHLYHYTHGSWSYVAGPLGGIGDVAPVGPDEAWAVGTQSILGGQTLLAHYVRGRWSTQSIPLESGTGNFAVNTPTNIILTGWSQEQDPVQLLSLQFDGTSWRRLDTGLAPGVAGAQFFPGNEGWAFSDLTPGITTPPKIAPSQHLANGVWSAVGWPFPNVTLVSPLVRVGAGDFWAVGLDVSGPSRASWTPVFFHFTGDRWYAYGSSG